MKTILSPFAGILTQNEKHPEWWKSSPVNIAFVEREMSITFLDYNSEKDPEFLAEADTALTHFAQLESSYKFEMSSHVIAFFNEWVEYAKKENIPAGMENVNALNIWNFIYPTEIFAGRRAHRDKDIYIILACECEWDKEHGLQFVFRKGKKLTRVSDQDGHFTDADAYDLLDKEDKLLSKF